MLTQTLKTQINRLSLNERWALLLYLIRSLPRRRAKPDPTTSNRLAALSRLRGIAKTDLPAPTDAEVAAMLNERRVERYI